MTWQEGVSVAVIVAGLGAAAFLVGQRPSFWVEFGIRIVNALMPKLIAYVTKRMPPEEEEAWRKCQLRGGKWNHRKRRCE